MDCLNVLLNLCKLIVTFMVPHSTSGAHRFIDQEDRKIKISNENTLCRQFVPVDCIHVFNFNPIAQ
jgi:hypothetical protein